MMTTMLLNTGPSAGQRNSRCALSSASVIAPTMYSSSCIAKNRKNQMARLVSIWSCAKNVCVQMSCGAKMMARTVQTARTTSERVMSVLAYSLPRSLPSRLRTAR